LEYEVNRLFGTVVKDYGQRILEAQRSQAQAVAHKLLHSERLRLAASDVRFSCTNEILGA
jgi:hypothetical protein